ncbi:MAG: hypothetical protein LBV12_12165 [Puniceicoccales bacterium]|jgi:hypothetical protein|nr:hypothetical protein [Puniceicoccales bacterium]
MTTTEFNPHVSVDCVLFGFDGEHLNVLLVEKTGLSPKDTVRATMKLPGRLVYCNEYLDAAASDVLESMTGIKKSNLQQFKSFGNPTRTSNREDLQWLKNQVSMEIQRVVTVAYMSTIRISTSLRTFSTEFNARWCPVNTVPNLIFDHNEILAEALLHLRQSAQLSPVFLFKLLPAKFTALELRKLYETVIGKPIDVRNFHKKIMAMPYVRPLQERQQNVAHRAARYYRFDKQAYNKLYK